MSTTLANLANYIHQQDDETQEELLTACLRPSAVDEVFQHLDEMEARDGEGEDDASASDMSDKERSQYLEKMIR